MPKAASSRSYGARRSDPLAVPLSSSAASRSHGAAQLLQQYTHYSTNADACLEGLINGLGGLSIKKKQSLSVRFVEDSPARSTATSPASSRDGSPAASPPALPPMRFKKHRGTNTWTVLREDVRPRRQRHRSPAPPPISFEQNLAQALLMQSCYSPEPSAIGFWGVVPIASVEV
ncbi:hypothetical protein DL93DRAFT_2087023 [Clavulina sp. PMI_390]|nr:hypothetical protein DL93DRAFT_2087023 [Clavulina sp. PMI_390]